jgi:hypothetical protein
VVQQRTRGDDHCDEVSYTTTMRGCPLLTPVPGRRVLTSRRLVGAVSDTVTPTHEVIDREVDRVRWTG